MGWIGLYKLDTRNDITNIWCLVHDLIPPETDAGARGQQYSVPCCVFPRHWLVRKTPISLVSFDFVVLIICSKVQ